MSDILTRLRQTFGLAGIFQEAEKRYNPDQPRYPEGDERGGQWSPEGGAAVATMDGDTDKPLPSPEDPLPQWLWNFNSALFENTVLGCAYGEGGRYGWQDSINAHGPYEAMDQFARTYGDGRTAERVFGNTPINQFLFRFANGTKNYELRIDREFSNPKVRQYHIYEAPSTFQRGRGRDKVPFWKDIL